MKGRLVRLAWAAGAATVPSLAFAQAAGSGPAIAIEPVLDRDDVAGARVEPAYRPQPIRIGPVLARPGISVVGEYLSNVFNRPEARAAAVFTVMPSIDVRADLPRHAFEVSAAGTMRRFSRHTTENSEEYGLASSARLDFGSRHQLRALAQFAHLIEPRSTAGSIPDAAEPVSYGRVQGELGAGLGFARFRLEPSLRYERLNYRDVALAGGGKADQRFRDTRSLRGEVRIEYQLSGLLAAFALAARENIDSSSAAAQRRDAHDSTLAGGLRGAISPVMSGEIALGYRRREHAQAGYRDFRGITYRADIQWYVTPLLTLRAQVDRSFRNSGNLAVGAIRSDRLTLSAFHDPLRNLRLSLSAQLERGAFGEVHAHSWRKTLRLRAQYRVTRSLSLGAFAGVVDQSIDGPPVVAPFTAFSAGLGMAFTS